MLSIHSITDLFSNQKFECKTFQINDDSSLQLNIESKMKTSDVTCPLCGMSVHVHDVTKLRIKDMPFNAESEQILQIEAHRYQCQTCKHSFNEEIPFKHPGTRITERAAIWIKVLLSLGMSIKSVSKATSIHWGTVSKVHKEFMDKALSKRAEDLLLKGYKPKRLAVDEFAIHKGHTYASCVMDIDEGDIIWVGKGRSIDDFKKFFETVDADYLSEVESVAMDMNASYNRLVETHLPNAAIVYDRYHMQAQFGKDVIGAVRLEEARAHKQKAIEIENTIVAGMSREEASVVRKEAKAERKLYRNLKRSRWTLLTNGENLNAEKSESLDKILESHSNLAICYAMKEEMCRLFTLRDPELAEEGWSNWFKAAKESGIPQLEKFAKLKERRLKGLVAHATHPISTGKLEGFNNKIKVAKRVGYGYRNDEYFFTLIRYSALPMVRNAKSLK